MTPSQLAAARALCEKATPGPWYVGDGWRGTAFGVRSETVHSQDDQDDGSKVCAVEREVDPGSADAAFIAASRQLVPDLLDALAQARAALAERDAQIARMLSALNWGLGVGAEFPMKREGQGNYWWRPELQRRAGLDYDGERFTIAAASLASRAGDGEGAG